MYNTLYPFTLPIHYDTTQFWKALVAAAVKARVVTNYDLCGTRCSSVHISHVSH